jgi:hypothetical protein
MLTKQKWDHFSYTHLICHFLCLIHAIYLQCQAFEIIKTNTSTKTWCIGLTNWSSFHLHLMWWLWNVCFSAILIFSIVPSVFCYLYSFLYSYGSLEYFSSILLYFFYWLLIRFASLSLMVVQGIYIFEIVSCYVAQAGLKLAIFLPQPPKYILGTWHHAEPVFIIYCISIYSKRRLYYLHSVLYKNLVLYF